MAKLITREEIKRIADMARIAISDQEMDKYTDMEQILELVGQIDKINTENVEPLAHPLNLIQRLRKDEVTEPIQRESLQAIAPNDVEAGVYLVPKVIEDE